MYDFDMYLGKAKRDKEYLRECLARYSGTEADQFQPNILLTNFHDYVELAAELLKAEFIFNRGSGWSVAHCPSQQLSIVCFGQGPTQAANIMDALSSIQERINAVLLLGKCGVTKDSIAIGDFVLPTGATRTDMVSLVYKKIYENSQPYFAMQQAASEILRKNNKKIWTGPSFVVPIRFWEGTLIENLIKRSGCPAVDMESGTLFAASHTHKIPFGALLVASDHPLRKDGRKTRASDKQHAEQLKVDQLNIGIEILDYVRDGKILAKHFMYGEYLKKNS